MFAEVATKFVWWPWVLSGFGFILALLWFYVAQVGLIHDWPEAEMNQETLDDYVKKVGDKGITIGEALNNAFALNLPVEQENLVIRTAFNRVAGRPDDEPFDKVTIHRIRAKRFWRKVLHRS